MAFDRYQPQVPSDVSALTLRFTKAKSQGETGEYEYAARYRIDLVDANGRPLDRVLQGDLVPHLTAQQVAGLKALIDDLYSKAQAEILP